MKRPGHISRFSATTEWRLRLCIFRIALFLLTLTVAAAAGAQHVDAIYDFSKTGDPQNPQVVGAIAQGRDGNMWSTTPDQVSNDSTGTAFKITPAGKLTVIKPDPFAAGIQPYGGLTLGTDGNFYGTTSNGGTGAGTVFKLTPKGGLTTLYTFSGQNDGKQPFNAPIQGTDGNFYGTTNLGGLKGYGTVYQMTPAGKLTPIHQFVGTDGAGPIGPLVQGTDGAFYGATYNSTLGDNQGVVYRVTSVGDFTRLAVFGIGSNSYSGLVQGNDGNFYGTTYNGGAHSLGQVFRITPKGVFTDIYDFTGSVNDGANPYAGLVLATDGLFYGVAANDGGDTLGTVYSISSKGAFKKIDDFDGTNGANPSTPLIQHTSGVLFGDTHIGGITTDYGTFYKVPNLHLKPFVSLLPTSGKVGAMIEILGQGFTPTTTVSFNNTAATSTFVSATYMTAVVPMGATTGFVTVTTPTATLKSNKKFRVTK